MEPSRPVGGSKPSKVEAIKLASEYLKTFLAEEVGNGSSHISEDAATVLKFHGSYQQDDRDVRTQHKKEGKEKAYQFMVRVRIVGGRLTADAIPGLRPPGPDDRQRHPSDHDPPGIPAPRRPEGRPQGDDPRDQREPALDAGGLRRRGAERALLPRSARGTRVRDRLFEDAELFASHCAPRSSSYWDIWLDGEKIETPPAGRRDPGAHARRRSRSSRSTARPTCRASSRRPSPCPRITAPTSTPTTWDTWRSSRTDGLSATTSWSAAAWARRPAPEDVPVPGRAALLRRPGRRAQDRRGGDEGLPRLRQPLGPQAGPAQVHHPRLGTCRPSAPRSRNTWAIPWIDPRPVQVTEVDDHLGWHRQADGKLFLGLPVENGRIQDEGDYRLLSGLAGVLREVPDARPADLPAVDPADRPRARLAARDRALAGRLRDRDGRADLDGPAVVDGLPGVADVRPGRHRGRARPARRDRRAGSRSWRGRASSRSGSPCG